MDPLADLGQALPGEGTPSSHLRRRRTAASKPRNGPRTTRSGVTRDPLADYARLSSSSNPSARFPREVAMTAKKFRRVRVSFVLIVALALGIGGGLAHDAAAKKAQWVAAWGFSIQGLSPMLLNDQTVRMIARPTVSGSALRVRVDNTFGTSPLVVGA